MSETDTPLFTVYGREVRSAWDAISSQDPGLLPAPALPVRGSYLRIVLDTEVGVVSNEEVEPGEAVEWRSGPSYPELIEPGMGPEDKQELRIKRPDALQALKRGLQEFQKGPSRRDVRRLRIGRLLLARERRQVAEQLLPYLAD